MPAASSVRKTSISGASHSLEDPNLNTKTATGARFFTAFKYFYQASDMAASRRMRLVSRLGRESRGKSEERQHHRVPDQRRGFGAFGGIITLDKT